jgi:hypothetical protein
VLTGQRPLVRLVSGADRGSPGARSPPGARSSDGNDAGEGRLRDYAASARASFAASQPEPQGDGSTAVMPSAACNWATKAQVGSPI